MGTKAARTAGTKVARVTVSVGSLERALPLYEEVLGLDRRYGQGGLVMLGTESPVVEVLLHERPPTPGDAGVAVSFAVADVDATTDRAVASGATVIDPPADQPWGERQSVLRDVDGHVLCLVSGG